MNKEFRVLDCPFCKKGKIEIIYIRSSVKVVKSSWGGSKGAIERSAEGIMVKTEKCPECGKTAKEIEKELKNESVKTVSHEERLKRLKDSGLPTTIEG